MLFSTVWRWLNIYRVITPPNFQEKQLAEDALFGQGSAEEVAGWWISLRRVGIGSGAGAVGCWHWLKLLHVRFIIKFGFCKPLQSEIASDFQLWTIVCCRDKNRTGFILDSHLLTGCNWTIHFAEVVASHFSVEVTRRRAVLCHCSFGIVVNAIRRSSNLTEITTDGLKTPDLSDWYVMICSTYIYQHQQTNESSSLRQIECLRPGEWLNDEGH